MKGKYTILDENGISALVKSVVKNFVSSSHYTSLQKKIDELNTKVKELSSGSGASDDLVPCECNISGTNSDGDFAHGIMITFTAPYPDGFNSENTLVVYARAAISTFHWSTPVYATTTPPHIQGIIKIPGDIGSHGTISSLTIYLKKIN